MDLSVAIGKKKLANPVGVASGTFGYGSEYERLIDFTAIGALYTKAVTLSPREGNDVPRIVETPSGILNSIGLANVGVERFLSEKMPFCATLPCAIIVNVAGSTKEEYGAVVERCEAFGGAIFGYEINISCPNVKHGGMAFGTDPEIVENLTADLRSRTVRPLIVKLTPNVTDITVIARAAQAGGADAVSCINTLVGMAIDVEAKRPVLPLKTGGLSGPAVRPVGVAAAYAVSRAVTIPVIGIGGIASGRDALEYLLAGASAVQVGTANFVDPSTAARVLASIREFAEREKLTCIKDFHAFIR
jgi:dihydroorotate dehydrogenase (NAD+) catalytic subunit